MMRSVFLAILPLTLAGCAAVKGADDPVTLRLTPKFTPAAGVMLTSISVAPVTGRGVTTGQRYAYVDAAAPGEVRQAKTFFWEEPPPRLIEHALVDGLRTRFPNVVGPETPLAAERRLVAVLDKFEERTGAETQAFVAFDASLINDGKMVMAGRYCGTAPIGDASGTARANAFAAAVTQAVEALVQDVASGNGSRLSC